jgi:hypothetical protein
MIASREVTCSRDIDSLSRSVRCITMPSARSRGMMIALWIGSVATDAKRPRMRYGKHRKIHSRFAATAFRISDLTPLR